jgi:preprotein translocase subunit Sec63
LPYEITFHGAYVEKKLEFPMRQKHSHVPLQAMKWHPDRHAMKSDDEKRMAEERFKLVSEASAVLQDAVKKRIFDTEGHAGLKRELTRL